MARVRRTDDVVVDDTERTVGDGAVVDREPVVERERVVDREPVVDRERVVDREPVVERDGTDVLAQEEAAFGGMKFGSAFFGWLTAAGMAVLLTALVAAIGSAFRPVADSTVVISARNLGIFGAVAVAVVLFVAYFSGGYVAGRMARFNGARQGFAVWLWAIIVAIVLGVVGLTLGARFDILGRLDAFPRIPLPGDDVTVAGIITAIVFAAIPLVGAILGGMAGMRYHRRVDRAAALY